MFRTMGRRKLKRKRKLRSPLMVKNQDVRRHHRYRRPYHPVITSLYDEPEISSVPEISPEEPWVIPTERLTANTWFASHWMNVFCLSSMPWPLFGMSSLMPPMPPCRHAAMHKMGGRGFLYDRNAFFYKLIFSEWIHLSRWWPSRLCGYAESSQMVFMHSLSLIDPIDHKLSFAA